MSDPRAGAGSERTRSRVLLVDDHPIVRQGLKRLMEQTDDLVVCGEAEDPPSAMAAISATKPDVAVLDLFLKEGDALDLIKGIRSRWPDLPVLVLTMQDQAFYAERALRAGAMGFLNKQEAGEKVVMAIHRLLEGNMYVGEDISPRLLKKLLTGESSEVESIVQRLSDRELQVFRLIGNGLGSKEIADQLNLSVKTIETYRAHIREKLDLKDSRDLLRYAIRWTYTQEGG